MTREPEDFAEQLRTVRDELARRNGDAQALAQAMAEKSKAAGRHPVRFAPRPPSPPRAITPPPAA
jgi:hypothetical protein